MWRPRSLEVTTVRIQAEGERARYNLVGVVARMGHGLGPDISSSPPS
jgi:hypothetical protein